MKTNYLMLIWIVRIKKVDIFKCMNNINNILNKEKIILTIDDKENFIASLLDNVLIEKEILEKED